MSTTYEPLPYLSSPSPSAYRPASPFKASQPDSAPALAARENARSKRPLTKIIMYSLPIVSTTVAMIVVLLAYIFILHDWSLDSHHVAINTSAALKNLLAIPQILSSFVSKTSPAVISVYAHQIAARWLKASGSQSQDRPSPAQLGIAISILHGGSIPAWIKAQYYRRTRRNPHWPSLLTQAIVVVGLVLAVSNLVTLFDSVSIE